MASNCEINLTSIKKSANCVRASMLAVISVVLLRIVPDVASVSSPAESKTLNLKSPSLAIPSLMSRVT